MNSPEPLLKEILKDALAHLQEPLLFQNMLQDPDGSHEWKLLEWDFSEFADKLGNIKLPFRVGYNARLTEFAENKEESEDEMWYYFDYKYMQEWFNDKPEILASLNWRKFGIDKDGSDSTLWIGSKGAHTNCHQDSYGYNLVAQIHGRKEWLLFPPSSSNFLEPTRIPYEESTVYSRFNFFCLSKEDEKKVLDVPYKPKVIILEPGDVLFVPWGWWHYVESLDHSMSINVWLPLKEDSRARLKEALVKLTVATIGGQKYSASEDEDSDVSYYTGLIDAALQECKSDVENASEFPSVKRTKYSSWTVEDLITQYPEYVRPLHNLEDRELQRFLQEKQERFPKSNSTQKLPQQSTDIKTIPPLGTSLESIINALCHPDVVTKAAELLLNNTQG
ncbi:PREDICTED: HSPB1-associated protein 1 isoform X2 [Dinoponera quadriceps]|uniref:HSPB1-associated protein 1 isoform X2 n=1 Tax=Dinoponera quadriceps TaxID=609295 RepID=A0A6P3XMN7_DINQU|nr:PREDICTED: HSPB1-associated protein 1 isoform X2 [Dinoponera quadriceps]